VARDPSDLSAYFDGELSRAESAETETWIREEPETAKEFKRLERSRTMLAQCIDRPMFHASLVQRVRVEESGRRKRRLAANSLLAAAAILLVIAAGMLALVQWRGADRATPDVTKSDSILPSSVPTGPPSSDSAPALAAAAPTETTTAPPPLDSTKLPLELMGTITGSNPMAVISVEEGPKQGPQVFQKGDAVLDGVSVVEVNQNQVVLDNHGQQTILTCAEEAATPTAPDLTGLWALKLIVGDEGERPVGEVQLEHSGTTLKLYDGANIVGEGRLSGRNVQFTPAQPPYDALGTVYGGFNSEWNQFTAPLGNLSQQALEVLGFGESDPVPRYLALKLDRVSSGNVESKRLEAARLQEVKAMLAPLDRFALSKEGQYPAKLEELVPDCVADLSLFADTATRKVQYIPGAVSARAKPIAMSELMKLDTSLPYPDALMKCEQALRDAGYAKFVYRQTVLKVTYTEPDAVYIGDSMGTVNPLTPRTDLADGATLASCQNNLKQLALVTKMFENENRGYTPPGWLFVYPEYLTDTTILTSPKDEPGTDSYLYLCPATNIKEYMVQAYADLDPAALAQIDWAQVESTIATVMNRTDFPNPKGRNVAFADGHVEFVPSSQIPPLLNFWSRRP